MARRRLTLSQLGVDPLSDLAAAQEASGSEIASPLSAREEGNPFTFAKTPKPGRLWAISDLHLSHPANRIELLKLRYYPNDGLILCGDIGESLEHLEIAFKTAKKRFATVWWTPGNHELYTLPTELQNHTGTKGELKYDDCIRLAREHDVLTPEDPFILWNGQGGPALVAPIFTLYDYSFKPDDVPLEDAVTWAKEEGIEATDEKLLHHEPYESRGEWCSVLVERFKRKLEETRAANPDAPLIIANHWPLREDLVLLRLIPRFSIWCGTKKTEDWHKTFNAKVVVSGHLHIRRTDWKDGTRFEECSLGYPRQWKECMEQGMDVNNFLREILPGPPMPEGGNAPTQWRRCNKSSEKAADLYAPKSMTPRPWQEPGTPANEKVGAPVGAPVDAPESEA